MSIISTDELKNLCECALKNADLRPQDISIIVDHYLENEMMGKASHGIVRVIEAAKAVKKYGLPDKDPEIVLNKGNVVIADAKGQMGPVAGSYITEQAITGNSDHGIAFHGIRNFIGNTGSMAYYLRRMADAGLISFMSCNSVALVAPPGGRKRMIGTNPVGIGMPADDGNHFIADFATSAIAYGKIMVAQDKGEALPEGVLVDETGAPSTDPADAYNGAVLPLADYRGFALGLMIELMAGPLIGAKAVKEELYNQDGIFIISINPEATGQDNVIENITNALDTIRNSPMQKGYEEITLPGERSANALKKACKNGSINVADETLRKLRELV